MSHGVPRDDSTVPAIARYVPLALVALVVFLCFLRVLACGFVDLDDIYIFVGNPNYRGLSPHHLAWMFTTFLLGPYQPLSWVTHGAVYLVWGMDPMGYHLVNLLLHVANALLFALFTQRLLQLVWSLDPPRSVVALPVAAAVGALFFAIHPLRVEAVAWVTERREVLASFFLLLTLLAYIRMERENRTVQSHVLRWWLISIVCYALSLLSKATAMTLPVVLLVLDVYPLQRFAGADGRLRLRTRVLVEKLPYLALALGAAAAALYGQRQEAALSLANHGLTARVAQAAYGLCFYLWKTLVPFGLRPLYTLERGLDPTQPQFVGAMLVVAAITGGLIQLRKRYPWALVAWTCYVVTVSPVLGFVQSGAQIAADRYTYVPCMPWAVLLAAGIYRLWGLAERGRLARPARIAIAAAILAQLGLFGVRTVQQTGIWKDSFSLWDHVLSIEPNALAYKNRGHERRVRGDLDGALADLNEALRREPEELQMHWGVPGYLPLTAHYERGKVLEAQGNSDAALAEFNLDISLDPNFGPAHAGRAKALQLKGDPDGALAEYDEALRLLPEDVEAVINRGNLRQMRGDLAGAIADFNQALTMEPERFDVYYNRANARKAMGDLDGALADYNEALRRKPEYGSAYNNRGNVRKAKGDLAGAIADYTEVIRLDPQHANAYTNRGNARRDSGDFGGAFADFSQALRLTGPKAPNRATLERNLAAMRQQLAARGQLPAAE